MNKLDLKKMIGAIKDVFRAEVVGKVNELVDNNNYKSYIALITQTSTNAPVATVLRNSIGDIVWTRANTGEYVATLANAFTASKTICFAGAELNALLDADDKRICIKRATSSTVALQTYATTFDPVGGTIIKTATDALLSSQTIEIRVYF